MTGSRKYARRGKVNAETTPQDYRNEKSLKEVRQMFDLKPPELRSRLCLKCQKSFLSDSKGNRLCGDCR